MARCDRRLDVLIGGGRVHGSVSNRLLAVVVYVASLRDVVIVLLLLHRS